MTDQEYKSLCEQDAMEDQIWETKEIVNSLLKRINHADYMACVDPTNKDRHRANFYNLCDTLDLYEAKLQEQRNALRDHRTKNHAELPAGSHTGNSQGNA